MGTPPVISTRNLLKNGRPATRGIAADLTGLDLTGLDAAAVGHGDA
jgi:hypothetical protein